MPAPPTPKPSVHSYVYSTHYVSSYDGKHHVEEVRQVEKENAKTLLNRYEKKVDGKVVEKGKAAPSPRKTLKVAKTKK